MDNDASWVVRKPQLKPKKRLFCFPYAGGSAAMYASWQSELGSEIEVCAVQLPGRANRFSETPCNAMQELTEILGRIVTQNNELPFSLFGHSLGALVAFEVARYCQSQKQILPEHLFVSGCGAPKLRRSTRLLHTLSDSQLLLELTQYGGTPPEILLNRELMQLLLPTIRADFSVAETYRYRSDPRLEIPISVFAGTVDDYVSHVAAVAWQQETHRMCDFAWLEGGHFFINPHVKSICRTLRAKLRSNVQ